MISRFYELSKQCRNPEASLHRDCPPSRTMAASAKLRFISMHTTLSLFLTPSAIESDFSKTEDAARCFPHVAGLTVSYDPGRTAGQRMLAATRGGDPLDLDATFSLAPNDYMAGGGDGYDEFEHQARVADAYAGTLMASQVIEYIAAQGSVAPVVEGRPKGGRVSRLGSLARHTNPTSSRGS